MDHAAHDLATLYDEVGPALLAYLRRQTSAARPEDLLHDVFCVAARRPDALAEAASPRAWLFGVARHVAQNVRRRTRTVASLDHEPTAPPDSERETRLAAVHAALVELPEPYRAALELRLRDDLSYAEIAEVLGVPIGTVRSRLHAAVKQLRERLRDT